MELARQGQGADGAKPAAVRPKRTCAIVFGAVQIYKPPKQRACYARFARKEGCRSAMMDFAAARTNMVESQIRPNKVTDPGLISALESAPRELFVPEDLKSLAYIDEDLQIAEGRYLMEPMVLARLLQAAEVGPEDMVLDVGSGPCYSTAILAKLAATVVALESDRELATRGNEVLSELGIDNAVVVEGDLMEGYAKQAPYDVILLGGAISEVPEVFEEHLAEGGRLITVLRNAKGLGRAVLMRKTGGRLAQRTLFECGTPNLPGFQREPGFVF